MDRQLTKADEPKQEEPRRELRLLNTLAKLKRTCVVGERPPRKDVTQLRVSEDKDKGRQAI